MSRDKDTRRVARPRVIDRPLLPPGPLHDLKALLYQLYLAAGSPTLDEIAARIAADDALPGAPARDTVRRCLGAPELPASQHDAVAVATVLAHAARWDAGHAAVRVRTLWVDAQMAPLRSPIVVTATVRGAHYVEVDDPTAGRTVLVPASGHQVRIFIEASGPETAVLTGLRPDVVFRRPASGRLRQHLGTVELRRFQVHLDESPPGLRVEGPGFPFTVASNDPEVFELTVLTTDDVQWTLILEWLLRGQTGQHLINLAGQPLRTMGIGP
jgi:hypothetical protein